MPIMKTPPPGSKAGSQASSESSFRGFEEWESSVDPNLMKEIKSVYRQRAQVKQKLLKVQRTLLETPQPGLAQLNTMSWNLKTIYSEFSGFHSKVLALVPDGALPEQEEFYDGFEELHSTVSTTVEQLVLEARSCVEQPATPSAPKFIIQQQPLSIPIPTFDGSYTSWPKFKAIFQGLMVKSTDSDAIKLYHLDKAMTKDAVGILDAKVVSEGNYEQAWKILEERFENTRSIVESHLRGLLNLKRMSGESFRELQTLLNETIRHVESLRYLKQEFTGISEHIVVFLLTNALDTSTRKAWEAKQKRGESPKYEPTISFLKSRLQVLESCEEMSTLSKPSATKPKAATSASKSTPQKSCASTSSSSSSQASCEFCAGTHLNFQCSTLKGIPIAEKKKKLQAAGACFNCLRKGHRVSNCPSQKTCFSCSQRHHTILHDDSARSQMTTKKSTPEASGDFKQTSPNPKSAAATDTPPAEVPASTSCSCNQTTATKRVLLPTAVVHAVDRNNKLHPCRVLLDSGSQVNFVTETMANLLGMPKTPTSVAITGINALRSHAREKVLVKFRSRFNDFHATIDCLVTPTVTGSTLSSPIDISEWKLPEGIELADPQFHTPSKIDLLVGAELFFDILKSGRVEIADDIPPLRETQLGWVVTGAIIDPVVSTVSTQSCSVATIEIIEKLVPNASIQSPEEKICEASFTRTNKRDEHDEYTVNLPLKNTQELHDCRPLAIERTLVLEKRLQVNADLPIQSVNPIPEYESIGHSRETKKDDPPHKAKYLPQRAVERACSSCIGKRIAGMQEACVQHRFQYILSDQIPAAIVSRAQMPEALRNNSLWWSGPAHLTAPDNDLQTPPDVPDVNLPELKNVVSTPAVTSFEVLSKNAIRKLQQVMAYLLRIVDNCHKQASERKNNPELTIEELRRSTNAIIHVVQHIHLNDEFQRTARGEQCWRVASQHPIHQDGLLRISGRLRRSNLPFASQHSIVLPDEISAVTIRALHDKLFINVLHQRYWLLNTRSTVKQETRSCVRCFRTNPTETTQLMGNLPEARVVPSPPFAITGVDYAGPFWIKEGKYRPKIIKAYVAVYVCMATRAVHLEAVSDLSSDAFIASLRRFVSRRGFVEQIHSDNGTNFKGANHELHELYRQFCDQRHIETIQNFCRPREIQWHFIPPNAPEFGGLWEAAVKSMKTHLKRTVGNARLTYEELATVLTEIEAILNSRPMYSISSDTSDPPTLTPAHYLIGRPLVAPAEPSLENVKVHRLDRWQHLQLMREHFWRAWSDDYLNSLQPRKKNLRVMPNVRPGMVVLIRDKNLPPLEWKMGHITAVYPDDENLVRVVDVYCDGSTFRRPITKLSILPIEDNKSDAVE